MLSLNGGTVPVLKAVNHGFDRRSQVGRLQKCRVTCVATTECLVGGLGFGIESIIQPSR